MIKSFLSFSLGCRVNQAEIELINRKLIEANFHYAPINPALLIINSCAVTLKAERTTRQLIYRLKRQYPKAKLVLAGCAATLWQQVNRLNQPVDLIISNDQKDKIVDLIINHFYHYSSKPGSNNKQRSISSLYLQSGRLLVKIQDGCHRFCTYCIVPYLRGSPTSFLIKDIIAYINKMSSVQEVILTAINSEAFGMDTNESLIDLINTVITKTSVPRISFGSLHPLSINPQFIHYYHRILSLNRLVNFFHIPIQSGSNKILKLMNRGYSIEDIAGLFNKIKKINPNALLATDIITGFLNESDADFEKSYRFIERSPINKLHIFHFSPRPFTAAYYTDSRNLKLSTKQLAYRIKALTDLGKKKYHQFLLELLDKQYQSPALFLSKKRGNYRYGLLDNQIPILVQMPAPQPKEIKPVRVKAIKSDQLIAATI